MERNVKFYKCPICGNVIGLISGDAKHMTCCGSEMDELKANTVDADLEKHIPVCTVVGDFLEVKVGEDSVFKGTKSKNDSFEVEVSGIGTITVKVYIDGVLGNRQKQFNLNTSNKITFE